ncbi:hypothetical protein Fmac_001617 [Flemingia macrophylla]|uniref:Uncharacterized protein n=1 Tax=Flemingia macrophylla TaxID=520843 RepID=A0ABD1NHL1_9FABA
MTPITTCVSMIVSSIFYVLWKVRVMIEEFTFQDRHRSPLSSLNYALNPRDIPVLF